MKFNDLVALILEGKEGPGVGIVMVLEVTGEFMEWNTVKLPFLDAYHLRSHSAKYRKGRVEVPENELPIMQSFTADDFNVEILPGLYACKHKRIKFCDGDSCAYERIYALLFTPGGTFYNDAVKVVKYNTLSYLPYREIYDKLPLGDDDDDDDEDF